MIHFPVILGPDGRLLVQQRLTHPAVYLDTWAHRHFAEDDPAAGDRFRTALLRAGGTLVLSDLNLGDFAGFADIRHVQAVGRFIDSLGPHLFFATFSPFPVIDREIAIMVRQTDQSPAGDAAMLQLYAEAAQMRNGKPSVQEWFAAVHTDRARLKPRLDGMAQAFPELLAVGKSSRWGAANLAHLGFQRPVEGEPGMRYPHRRPYRLTLCEMVRSRIGCSGECEREHPHQG